MWIPLNSEQAIQALLSGFDRFADGCLREVSLATETYVNERLAMACPGHLDTSAFLYFQRQSGELSAIELRCEGVTAFRLRPTADGCDSIVSSGTITVEDETLRLAVSFVGGPLRGPPNSGMWLPTRSLADPDLEVVAQRMEWRAVDNGLGNHLRYRASHSNPSADE
jgi:hypothetical protein